MAEKKQNIHEANWANFILAISASILDSGFTHGYHMGLIQELKKPVEDWLNSQEYSSKINESIKISHNIEPVFSFSNFIESCYELGGVMGCCFMVMFADKFGRKGGMLMTTFISIFASIFGGYSKYFGSVVLILISRVLYGIKHGINSGLGPMYLMEISPQDKRGLIASSYGLFVSIGILVSKILTQMIANKLYWPLALSLPVIPAIIQLSLLPFCPESPKYLFVMKKNEWECRKALKWLRGSRYKEEEEIDNIRNEYNQRAELGEIRLGFILKNRILRSALITSTILVVSQQLCGIVMLLNCVDNRFSHLNHDYHIFALLSIKIVGGLIPFFIIERVSRRKLLLYSFGGMAVTSFILCAFFEWIKFSFNANVIFFLEAIFLVSYKIGCGSVCYFSPSEYFNTSAASIAYSVGAGSNWFLRWCIITFGVPFITKLRGYSFLNYMVTNTVLFYYVFSKVPETRDKSIKEVYRSIHAKIK